MDDSERLAAIEAIRNLKARYWRGVDSRDDALVRSILAEDCVLDYMACCTDPATGVDHMPMMNMVMKGRDTWNNSGPPGHALPITVHQGHQSEIEVGADGTATGTWYFTDRFFMPEGSPFSRMTGYGIYHDTYQLTDDGWKLKTTRIERIRVEVA